MKAHELAKALLELPNVPVVINGWGNDEGFTFEVSEISPLGTCSFSGVNDTKRTARDSMGYQKPRKCLSLFHGNYTPASDKQVRAERASERKERAWVKKHGPRGASLTHAVLSPLTLDMFSKL